MQYEEPSKYKIGDVVEILDDGTDGYVTDSEYEPDIDAYVYFVETSYGDEWFRASDLKKIYRSEQNW